MNLRIIACLLYLLTACQPSAGLGPAHRNYDPSFSPTSANLATSCEQVADVYARGYLTSRGYDGVAVYQDDSSFFSRWFGGISVDEAGLANADLAVATQEAASFSDTNVQVQGVDEADYVEAVSDYIVYQTDSRLWQFDPISETVTHLDYNSQYPLGLYGTGQTTFVALRGSRSQEYWGADIRALDVNGDVEDSILDRYRQVVELSKFHLRLDAEPAGQRRVIASLVLEGSYISSRKSRGQIVVALRQQLEIDDGSLYENYRELVEDYEDEDTGYYEFTSEELEGLLSEIQSSVRKNITNLYQGDCSNIYLPNTEYLDPEIMTLHVVDTKSLTLLDSVSIVGGGDAMYMDHEQILLAGWGRWFQQSRDLRSPVFSFGITDADVSYAGVAQIRGYVPGQFAMHRYANTMYVASQVWDDQSSTSLSAIDQESLSIVDTVDAIAPNEQMRSVRFVDQRAYIVTFRQVDPLFVIDIAEPKDLRIMGELKIPGFSQYIHPYDDDRLLTVGVSGDEFGVDGGLSIQSFDVADPVRPRLISQTKFGGNGLYVNSESQVDHHAFAYSDQWRILTLPYSASEYFDNGEHREVGVVVIGVDEDGELRTKFTHQADRETCSYQRSDYYCDHDETPLAAVRRVVYDYENEYILAFGTDIRQLSTTGRLVETFELGDNAE